MSGEGAGWGKHVHAQTCMYTQQAHLLDCMICFADVFGVELISKIVYARAHTKTTADSAPPHTSTSHVTSRDACTYLRWFVLLEVVQELALCHFPGRAQLLKHWVHRNAGRQCLGSLHRLRCWLATRSHVLLLGILRHVLQLCEVRVQGVQLPNMVVFLVQQVLRYAPIYT